MSGRLSMGLSQHSAAETCPWGISTLIEPLSFLAGLEADCWEVPAPALASDVTLDRLTISRCLSAPEKRGLKPSSTCRSEAVTSEDSPFRSHSMPPKHKDQYKVCGEQRVLCRITPG